MWKDIRYVKQQLEILRKDYKLNKAEHFTMTVRCPIILNSSECRVWYY